MAARNHAPGMPGIAMSGIGRAIADARAAEPLEFDQIIVRFAVGLLITIYMAVSYAFGEIEGRTAWLIAVLLGGAWLLGIGFLVHLALWPRRRMERRAASIVADAVELSLVMGYGGQSAAMFFPVYLWVTLGNGFRFGLRAMYAAMALNCGAFLVMAAVTPYWHDAWQFTAGVALAIVVIPLYVAKLIRNLRSAMTEAEAASRAKTDFLSMMSHELRTPLNAILGLAQLSRFTATSAKERFGAISTELAAGRLLRMVDTILKFHLIESGAAERHDRSFDPLDMLNEARAIIEPLARQKGLDFRIRFTTGLPDRISADPDHIQTIILNLLTNAVKYTPRGQVSLEIGMRNEGRAPPALRIAVRDTGPGIPPEGQKTMFDRFVRGREHVVSAEPGVGLGLSLCRSLTEMLGGRLGCVSAAGEGSLFWAELPVVPLAEARPAKAEAPVLWLAPPASPGEGAIIARDAEGLRALMDDEAALAETVFAADAAALSGEMRCVLALAMAKAEHPPALVLFGACDDLAPLATASAPAGVPSEERAALIGTVARWQRRLAQQLAAEAPSGIPLTRSLRILVADDNALNRDVTRRMLELDGHEVVLAETGDDALQHLLGGAVEMAMLDVNMPGLSGIEAAKTYRVGLGSGAVIPMIGITADISVQTRKDCLTAGMLDVLAKPVTMEQLRKAIAAYVLSPDGDLARAPEAEPPAPPADAERVAFLRELLGESKFRDHFLPSFKRDIALSLDQLRQGVRERRTQAIRDALHAIKSSASTAGASQLGRAAAAFEHHGRAAGLPGWEEEIEAAMQSYCALVERSDAAQPALLERLA